MRPSPRVATTGAIGGGDIRDNQVEGVETRDGLFSQLPVVSEWLSDNGPRNCMAEVFVKTLKLDYRSPSNSAGPI